MVNTQQIIVTILLINMVLGMITQMYIDVRNYNDEIVENELLYTQGLETGFEDEEGLYSGLSNANYQEQQTVGNKLKWSSILLKGMFRAIVPIYPKDYAPETQVEELIQGGFNLLRGFMYILIAFEAFMIFYSRKTN